MSVENPEPIQKEKQNAPPKDPYGIYAEIASFITKEIDNNPDRLATPDGTLKNEVGC
jgi:hypothetical protein